MAPVHEKPSKEPEVAIEDCEISDYNKFEPVVVIEEGKQKSLEDDCIISIPDEKDSDEESDDDEDDEDDDDDF